MLTHSIHFLTLARFGPAPKFPDTPIGWFTVVTLGIIMPIAALYVRKRMKQRKK